MPSIKKVSAVNQLRQSLEGYAALIFTDYQGLGASQINNLRATLREAGAELRVVKNNLLEKVNPEFSFQGPTAIVITKTEEIDAFRALATFIKVNEGLPVIKRGILEGKWLGKDQVTAIALLPGRNELLAQVVRGVQAPVSRIVGVLSGVERGLVFVLSAVAEQKQGGDSHE